MTSVGLDLGGTNVKTAVIAGEEVVATGVHPTPAGTAGEIVEAVASLVGELVAQHSPETVGFGVPGQFDAAGVLRDLPNLAGDWDGYPLKERLEGRLGREVALLNDAQGFTLAEARLGTARGYRTVQGVALGTGIGGGLVIEGRLHKGADGSAGEIGHQVIDRNDETPCSCGRRGCLEALARASVLTDLAGRDTAQDVFVAAAGGDDRAREAIATAADRIGLGLANVATLVNPDAFVIGGGLAEAGYLLLDPIRDSLKRHLRIAATPPPVLQGALGITAGAVGAALAAAER